MPIQKHDLEHEFPEFRDRIGELTGQDPHFASLCQRYNDVDQEVRRIEEGNENADDLYLEERKKVRVHLKDELYRMLQHQ